MNKKSKRNPGSRLSAVVMLFYFLAFLLLALRRQSTEGYILAVAVPALIFAGTNVLPRLFPTDRLLISLTNFLCAMGILLLYDVKPDYALPQSISYGIGLLAMIVCIYLVRELPSWNRMLLFIFPTSLLLLILPLIFGQEIKGAKNWISIGSFSFQPSEVVKLSLVLTLAWFFARSRSVFALLFSFFCLTLLFLQKDLGTALLYYCVTLLLFWISSGNVVFTLIGLAGGVGFAWFGYQQIDLIQRMVSIWLDPWTDFENAGYQIVQGLNAISRGGLWGTGLGLGDPASVPVYQSDYIFAVLCEQFGVIIGFCVLAMFALLIWRGASTAMAARRRFHSLLAMGATMMLGLQTFIIIGGIMKLIPLTGVTLPFISYGGTSLVSSLCLVGFIQGVESLNADFLEEDARMMMLERNVS